MAVELGITEDFRVVQKKGNYPCICKWEIYAIVTKMIVLYEVGVI